MNYSHNYSKLSKDEYTTIRRYSKGKVDSHKAEVVKGVFSHWVRVKAIERFAFDDIPTSLLIEDTDCTTRTDAFKLLQSFYRKPIDKKNEKLYIYYLEKLERRE